MNRLTKMCLQQKLLLMVTSKNISWCHEVQLFQFTKTKLSLFSNCISIFSCNYHKIICQLYCSSPMDSAIKLKWFIISYKRQRRTRDLN